MERGQEIETDRERERPHRKLDRNSDKSLKPGKWEAARGEVVGQSHFKDKCI